ncbi:brr2 [Candida pseudojiufengensis]|uniref:brr2 n=1 Tax=Candida pseudojiufengensis TaxID=497109 RepID=UPI0022240EB2|nr:brr2 [Candida pseudojiufengensis]KAI5963826.1 brr2 [Candida pseudojiufengensis]
MKYEEQEINRDQSQNHNELDNIYDIFLDKIRNHLLDSSPEVINSAVEVLLELLSSNIQITTKRSEINQILNISIQNEELSDLINLAIQYQNILSKHKSSDETDVVAVEINESEDEDEEVEEIESEHEFEEEGNNVKTFDWRNLSSEERADEIYNLLQNKTMSDSKLNSELRHLTGDFQTIIDNRWRIVFSKRLQTENREDLFKEMQEMNLTYLILDYIDIQTTIKRLQSRKIPETYENDLKVALPKGTFQEKLPKYDIITIPPNTTPTEEIELLPITKLPEWAREVFPSNETTTFNKIQSKIFPMAFESDENLLICAPTGAGKTNVAMLTMLRTIDNYRSNHIRKDEFKIVYIAPLKALVQEQMREFQRRLTSVYGLIVNELTGDSSLSLKQIQETNVIVTTPEKWDIITRKNHEYIKLVKLIIIDEIHLLHDQRGPVLEGIVSRVLRSGDDVRIVGLSATLPNYQDVAKFIEAGENGVFYFDSNYRPCPLEQKFFGIKEQNAVKKKTAMNEACYDQTLNVLEQNQQLIIFVHSRNETFTTAEYLVDTISNDYINETSKEILLQESERVSNNKLRKIMVAGFGIHHAGLTKEDRTLVEDLFAQGHLKGLVSTATLAWGVNLPAHTVIIKGTEIYSPELGGWTQLSPQDIFQMLGRAGRPRYDKNGEGIIITTQDKIQYYLAVLNQQYPIESQLMTKLIDNVNAEIVAGTIKSLEDGIDWLGYTYLFVKDHPDRLNLIHAAFTVLFQHGLILCEKDKVSPTQLGKIASYHYISYETISKYNNLLKSWHTESDVIRVFSHSDEFQFIPVRREERIEINKLMEQCPIPIKELPTEPLAKVNILLQTYISRLSLEGYALVSDMIYIKQSADRLLHALYEIAINKKWSSLAKIILNLSKMVKNRLWISDSPLRQLSAPNFIIKASESSHLPWYQYFNLPTEELAEILNLKGNQIGEYMKKFPKLDINYTVQTIDKFLLIKVESIPSWDNGVEPFALFLDDCDGNLIQYKEVLLNEQPQIFEFYVLNNDLPNLMVSFVSTKWVNCTWKRSLVTDVIHPKDKTFFTEKTSTYDLLTAEENAFIGTNHGKTKMVEDALENDVNGRIVYIGSEEVGARLIGDLKKDIKIFNRNRVISSSPAHFYGLIRRWKNLKDIKLFIFDDLHLIESEPTYEFLITRIKILSQDIRIIGISYPLIDARDMGSWLDVSKTDIINFAASERDVKLEEINFNTKMGPIEGKCIIFTAPENINNVKESYQDALVTTRKDLSCPKSELVVIDGTQILDEFGYVDYGIVDIYNMIDKSTKKVSITTSSEMIEYYSSFINTGIVVESALATSMYEFFIDGIVNKLLKERQDCIDILTHTFFYRRLISNPSYYGLKNVSSLGISEYLSGLIEDTLEELESNEFIEDMQPLNKALIASHYNLSFDTLNLLSKLGGKSKLKEILLTISKILHVPVRTGEETILKSISRKMPMKDFDKTFILIQAYISRIKIPKQLEQDQISIIEKLTKILNACIDVLSGEGLLNAMIAMDIIQMINQKVWSFDTILKQIPKFNEHILSRCKEHNVETVYDVMALEDDERDEVLQLSDDDLNEVAMFVNQYPNIKLNYEIDEELIISLERDEEMESLIVPNTGKEEYWWLVIGNASTNQLFAIKKVQLPHLEQSFKFEVPDEDFTCWAICDSYLGVDKEVSKR